MKSIRTLLCVMLLVLAATTAWAAPDTLARQVLAEINVARTDPHGYAEHLRRFRGMFQGKGHWDADTGAIVITTEGVPAVDEAIEFLAKQKPVSRLTWSDGLAQAAADLVRDEGATGEVGHSGRSSGDMRQRIERHGTWKNRIAEDIGYGSGTARLAVMELIIDDGVSGRGHRKNIFNPDFAVAGVSCGPHPRYQVMCVIDFAGGFHSKETK